MMKKLLVLSLVLAVCGLANAGLVLGPTGNGAQVSSIEAPADQVVYLFVEQPILATGFGLIMPPAGPFSTVEDYGIANGELDWGVAGVGDARILGITIAGGVVAGTAVLNEPGIQFTLVTDRALFAEGSGARAVLYNESLDTVLGTLYSVAVPEPMTMGLLGLGALFLRKRK
jgi:hypothetical protein